MPFLTAVPSRLSRVAPSRRVVLVLLFAMLALSSLLKARLTGDGLEYLMMTQSLVAHQSVDLRESDIEALAALKPRTLQRASLNPAAMKDAMTRIRRDGAIELGFARGIDGKVYAIHFWMFSLLAAPFAALGALMGVNPFVPLVALSIVFLAVTASRLLAWFPRAGALELALLAVMGPVFYLSWSGPEVMSGCCVLLAVLAALRRDLALSVALAGLGATQNPSIAGLIPAAAGYWLLYRIAPSLSWSEAPRRPALRNVFLVAAGALMAALPFLYNQAVFGVPSIIGKHFTDRSLVTPERMFSFLFDLNQGLFIGFPALLSCAAIVLVCIGRERRKAWLAHAAIAFVLTLGLALPTLSATNWNSGAIIVSRYAYWAAMPLLAVCILGLVQLDARARRIALLSSLALQALAAWQAYRPGVASYLVHGRIAQRVLDRAPRFYNPDPEIFLKRELHKEVLLTNDTVIVHEGVRGATKLMRHWTNDSATAGLCAPGTLLKADHVTTLASGWRYYNGALRCEPGREPGRVWTIGADPEALKILASGWSHNEGTGVWSDGKRSRLLLTVPEGREARFLALLGGYYETVKETQLAINGIPVGTVVLGRDRIPVPPAARASRVLEVELVHSQPGVPAGATSSDARQLGFFLRSAYLELAP